MFNQVKINRKPVLIVSIFLFSIAALSNSTVADITTTGQTNPAYDSSDPWNITDGLTVGIDSDGTMTISDGSTVNSSTGYIAGFLVGTGNSTITDADSLWTNSGDLYVGFGGAGNMTISNGGRISDANGYAGYKANSAANVEITGSGSLWQNSGDLYLGYSGTADVLVSNGGTITNADGYIGYHSGLGTVTITGTDSLWQNSGDLYIANRGFAELTISDGAKISNNNAFIGYGSPPAVQDPGLDYEENELLIRFAPDINGIYPGTEEKNAILASLGGGIVTHEYSIVEGLALVELPENTFANPEIVSTYNDSSDILYAELNLVAITTAEWLGAQEGPASVTVTGAGSLWENAGTLYIGGNQTEPRREATLTISDGGTVQANEVMIWDEGILTGDSLLQANTVTNKGTIRPGNSIGTLTIDGDLTMQADSTLEIEVNNSGNSDKLIVTGDTTIEGGTVHAISTETITDEQEYTILETSSITGTFDGIDVSQFDYAFFSFELGYETDSVKLSVSTVPFDDSSIVLSNNQKAFGTALQQIADDGGNSVTTALQQLASLNEVRSAYDQLSGQTRTSLASATTSGNTHFTGTVSGRLHNTRGMAFDDSDSGSLLTMANLDRNLKNASIYDIDTRGYTFALGNGTGYYSNQKWGFWSKGYVVLGDRETQSTSPGYQYTVYGTGFGLDYQFTESLLLGITGGYSDSDVDYSSSRDKSDVFGIPLGIYGSRNTQSGYFDSILTYTPMEYKTKRYVDLTSEMLSGEFDGYQISGYLEAGRNYNYSEDCLIQPMASFQLSYLNLDSYIESGGSSALSYDDQSYESYKGSLGMKIKRRLFKDTIGQSSTVELRGRWVHEFGETKSNVTAHFADHPSSVFTISDEDLSKDSAVFGVGFKKVVKENTTFFIDYDTSLNKEDTSHIISAGFGYRW